jgi:putative ABC transport system permease protein
VGRLAPGVTREQAVAELARVSAQLERSFPDSNRGWSADFVSFRQDVLGQLREGVIVLFVAAGFVLLIVCGNLANLLIARGAGRQREIALRAAIGAGRGRLVRQLLTESALLASAGAGLAVIVAIWGVRLLRASATGQLPAFIDITVQPRVFFFQFALATWLCCSPVCCPHCEVPNSARSPHSATAFARRAVHAALGCARHLSLPRSASRSCCWPVQCC